MEKSSVLKTMKSGMGFKTVAGDLFFIGEEDLKDIAGQLVLEMIIHKNVKVVMSQDSNVLRADRLYNILKEQKDMGQEIKDEFLRQVLILLSERGEDEIIDEDPLKKEEIYTK